jgi:hypothetical protein
VDRHRRSNNSCPVGQMLTLYRSSWALCFSVEIGGPATRLILKANWWGSGQWSTVWRRPHAAFSAETS